MWRSWGRFLLEGLWSLRSTHALYHEQRQPVLALERRVVRGLACGQETSGMREVREPLRSVKHSVRCLQRKTRPATAMGEKAVGLRPQLCTLGSVFHTPTTPEA